MRKWVCVLQRLEKISFFFRCLNVMDVVLKCFSDKFEGNWIQLLFYYLVLVNVAASFSGKKNFHLWVRFYVESRSYRSVAATFANGFQKSIDQTLKLIPEKASNFSDLK